MSANIEIPKEYERPYQRVLQGLSSSGRIHAETKMIAPARENLKGKDKIGDHWEAFLFVDFLKKLFSELSPSKQKEFKDAINSVERPSSKNPHYEWKTLNNVPSNSNGFPVKQGGALFKAIAQALDCDLVSLFHRFLKHCEGKAITSFYHPPEIDTPENREAHKIEASARLSKTISDLENYITNSRQKQNLEQELESGLTQSEISEQPHLIDPTIRLGIIHYYGNQTIEILGREAEQENLRRFLQNSEVFSWLQLAGLAGQGKSRLAYEFIIYARNNGWSAGFLSIENTKIFSELWASWHPNKPHLIVIDYVIGRENHINKIIHALTRRHIPLPNKVRILLIERQRWDIGSTNSIQNIELYESDSFLCLPKYPAEWFIKICPNHDIYDIKLIEARFESGVISLEPLNTKALIKIVRTIAEKSSKTTLGHSDSEIENFLKKIDKNGRPLYAYFLGQVIAKNGTKKTWSRNELLREILTREFEKRYKNHEIFAGKRFDIGGDDLSLKLALLATIVRELDCRKAASQKLIPKTDSLAREAALILTDSPLGKDVLGRPQIIHTLEPDLLGEWFVLSAIGFGHSLAELMDTAWQYSPNDTAAFLQRLAQDFLVHHTSTNKQEETEIVREILTHKPPNDVALECFRKSALEIIKKLVSASMKVPNWIITSLENAADKDSAAMFQMGCLYFYGWGVERNLAQAAKWYERGALAGDAPSMTQLGVCYARSLGVSENPSTAFHWYQKAAEAGIGQAMANLGGCYYEGYGTDKNFALAAYWYEKGAAAEIGQAMTGLGVLYEYGHGFTQDSAKAVYWYEKGAQAGNGMAKFNLGLCYLNEMGVEKNPDRAAHLFQEAAASNSILAKIHLGVCYLAGVGVVTDHERAASLFQEGVDADIDLAMVNLGLCYLNGWGVAIDIAKAASLFERGAAKGNDLAKLYRDSPSLGTA